MRSKMKSSVVAQGGRLIIYIGNLSKSRSLMDDASTPRQKYTPGSLHPCYHRAVPELSPMSYVGSKKIARRLCGDNLHEARASALSLLLKGHPYLSTMDTPLEEPSLFTPTTVAALSVLSLIITVAYYASLQVLPESTNGKMRTFYVWHVADGLVHLILEASFLYNCFFTYIELPPVTSDYPHPASLTSNLVHFLDRSDRSYGSDFGSNVFAKLWQEYAKADKRWGGADLNVISLELLTVFIGGPLAIYVSELIRRGGGSSKGAANSAKLWFWGSLLATGELYGGFMTFCPEWLSVNKNLDGSSCMKL